MLGWAKLGSINGRFEPGPQHSPNNERRGRMKRLFLVAIVVLLMAACSNPSVPTGVVGYATNQPIFIGEKGEFLGIIIGPSSYGFGWKNQIRIERDYRPWTVTENFSKGRGDERILSFDNINMEVSIAVTLGFLNSPVSKDYNRDKFKSNMRNFFENYWKAWGRRYRKPFRAHVRNRLSGHDYKSAKKKRIQLSGEIKAWVATMLGGTPFEVLHVNLSNINPPTRLLDEQELLKAAEVREKRQAKEAAYQRAKKEVMKQEAQNLTAALEMNPRFLEWRRIMIMQRYTEAMNTLITGDEAKSISKVVFFPYGTPLALSGAE